MDFQAQPPNDNYCSEFSPAISSVGGCIKFIGLPIGSTVEIYTIALALVRSYGPETINYPIPAVRGLTGPNPNVGWIAWGGDNDDRNPVSSGLYFYKIILPTGEPLIGKLAITRPRKMN